MARQSSITVIVDKQRYFLQRTKVGLPPKRVELLRKFEADFIAVTAISWYGSTFHEDDLRRVCNEYTARDDVWNGSFLSLIILLQPHGLKTKIELQGNNVIGLRNDEAKLPRGPLMVEKSSGALFRVAKLVPDTHFAFLSAIVPKYRPRSSFEELPNHVKMVDLELFGPAPNVQDTIEIALPSRLYFDKTELQPLAGLRIAVKDTIALKGLRTGYGSAAWAQTYEPEKYTAPCVRQLIDAGAIVVGKAKSSEFAEGVDPAEWNEGICPYNPRGDGQQKPSSSSTGSASAMAAYEWLDVALGTDTGGSIRHPAGVQGLFGQRPTHGRIDLTGVLGATPLFNTVGIFARDTQTFTKVGGLLVNRNQVSNGQPRDRKYNLLYPIREAYEHNRDPFHGNQLRWFPHPSADPQSYSDAEKQIENVVSKIESELNCKRVPFNVDQLWRATHPIGQSRSIDEATGSIYGVITTASACKGDIDQFVHDFKAVNEGKSPRISQLVSDRFDYGRRCSNEKIEAALEATNAFSRWVLNDLFGSLDQDATTLLIFPQSWGRPDYRQGSPEIKGALFKEFFSIYSFAYLCGCPDYTVPIGEVPYQSPITNQTEYLPVSISLLGRPGTDLELFSVIDLLHEQGVISDVQAGRRMYTDSIEKVSS